MLGQLRHPEEGPGCGPGQGELCGSLVWGQHRHGDWIHFKHGEQREMANMPRA